MDFAEYPTLNGDLAVEFHNRHFARRDTHIYDPNHVPHMPHFNPAAIAGLAVDVKPRLTKEQHDILENEFQKQSKPNTNTKKRFAEVLGVSLDKVNVCTPNLACRIMSASALPKHLSSHTVSPVSNSCCRTGFRTAEPSPNRMPKNRPEPSTCSRQRTSRITTRR